MKITTRSFAALILLYIMAGGGAVRAQGTYLSHYIFPAFVKGTVKFKNNGSSEQAMLNYNSLTQEMLFMNKDTPLALDQIELIDTIYIEGRKFIPTEKAFLEVVNTGKVQLFIKHKCTVIPPGKTAGYGTTSHTSGINSVASISPNQLYKLQLPSDFKLVPETEFLFRKGKDYIRITGSKQLINAFPAKAEAIKEYVKQNNPNFKNAGDVIKLIAFCNNPS